MNGEDRELIEQVTSARVEGHFKELAAKIEGVVGVLTERMTAGDRETVQLVRGVESEIRHIANGMDKASAVSQQLHERLEITIRGLGERIGALEQDAAVVRSQLGEARSDITATSAALIETTGKVSKLEHFRWLLVGAILGGGGLGGLVGAAIAKASP